MSSISFAVKLAKASIPDDLRNDIKYGNYPHVARTADPLLVRPNALSLMVADTVYNARVKLGLGCKGYYIYASGLGIAIYENVYTNDREFNIEFGTNDSTPDSDAIKAIKEKAKEWLDELEVAIASHPSDNSIKKAIDRLCWQMHYDITESHLNFPEAFSDNDFADVKIDRYPLDSTYFDGYTLKTTISDIAGVEHSSELLPSGQVVVNVTNEGYFSETSDRIQAFDDHMTVGAFESHVDQDTRKEVVDTGALKLIQDNIVNFDNHMTAGAWSSTVVDGVDTVNNGALNKIATKLVPDGNDYYSISECLRDKQTINGKTTFSIARSLRESGQDSVSQATHDQTELEEQRFTDIDNTLGDPSDSTASTIFGSISSNSSTINGNISDAKTALSGDISGAESSINGNISGVNNTVGDINRNLGTKVLGDIGGNVSTKTAMDVLADMHSALFGHECNTNDLASHDYRGSYGIAWGPTSGANSTLYVKSVDL